jgi:hypothetical protein
MKKLLYTTSVALCLAGCGGGPASDKNLIVLDLAAAIDNPRPFDLAEIARNIEYIPLDGAVPVGEINMLTGMRPAKNGFYLVAQDGENTAWNFDRTGKFISTVGRIGRGPGETGSIVGVSPNDATDEIYIDGTTDVVGLDADGKEFARVGDLLSWGMRWHGDRLLTLPVALVFDEEVFSHDTIPFIDMYDRELRHIGSIPGPNVGPFMGLSSVPEEGYVPATSPPFFSDNGERLLIKQGRNDTLYHFSSGTIRPAYLLDLGAYTPPAEVFGFNPAGRWTERNFTVPNVWEGERWMIVAASNIIEKTMWGLIFDRRNPEAGGFSATGGVDGKQGLFVGGAKFTPCYIRDNRLVGYIQAFDLVDNADRITDPKLKEIAAAIREESNPVITIIQL